jgi:hypothetical protein
VLEAERFTQSRKERLHTRPAMMHDPLTTPRDACSSDANRAGTDASAPLPEWVIHLIAMVIRFMLERMLGTRSRRSGLISWAHDRPDLPAGSIEALAASLRGPFGRSIAWMCRRRGIGPGHPDWPELSRAIVAFGGSVKGARPGLPALGLLWWENPDIIPGMIGETRPTPAATALALLLSRQAAAAAPSPAPRAIVRSEVEPVLAPAFRRQVSARTATGPPTGPPSITGPPAVWAHQYSYV